MVEQTKVPTSHRFLDEAGDPTFFKKGRILAVGEPGVSLAFSLGMVKFNGDLQPIRAGVRQRREESIWRWILLSRNGRFTGGARTHVPVYPVA